MMILRAEKKKFGFFSSCRENNFSNESNEDETLPAGQLVIFPPTPPPHFATHFKPPSPPLVGSFYCNHTGPAELI